MILATIVSANSLLLKRSLEAYAAIAGENVKFCVIDTPATHALNRQVAKKHGALHAEENVFRHATPEELRFAFAGKHGGVRNIGLALAYREKADCVFLDDDTLPANNLFEIYGKAFSEKRQVVCGQFLKHAGGTASLLVSIMAALDDFQQKRAGAGETSDKIDGFLHGIPIETKAQVRGAGLVGGNTGISFETLSRYAFLPTSYRVEDGVYGEFAEKYGARVFAPENPPLVFHERQCGSSSCLRDNLLSECRGSVIAETIRAELEGKRADTDTAAKAVFKKSLLAQLREKQELNKFEVHKLTPHIALEYARLLEIAPSDLVPENAENQAELFFKTQDCWKEALGSC